MTQRVPKINDNYIVIRKSVGYLTQWGSSWWMERVCGRGGIRMNCGNLWKSQRPHLLRNQIPSSAPLAELGAANRAESAVHIARVLWPAGIPRFGSHDSLALSIALSTASLFSCFALSWPASTPCLSWERVHNAGIRAKSIRPQRLRLAGQVLAGQDCQASWTGVTSSPLLRSEQGML
jgi:hypothetical protein